MTKDDPGRILEYLKRIDESINGSSGAALPTERKLPLSDRIDRLDNRVSDVQLGLATLAADSKARFEKVDERFDLVDARLEKVDERLDSVDARLEAVDVRVDSVDARLEAVDARFSASDGRFNTIDKRFDAVDHSIESARVEIVDLVTRVHSELTGRIVDLEVPGLRGKGGGGKGSGGSGVPLAS